MMHLTEISSHSAGAISQKRSMILYRFADLIEKHNDEIAALETWDNGKPYEQAASAEVPMLVRLIRYYAGKPSLSP